MIVRFINKFISFLMISGISYVLLIIIWGFEAPDSLKKNLRNPDGGSFLEKRLAEAKEIEDVDILFLGASTTYMGFDTEFFRETGYKTFNLGSGAQTPEQTQVLLKRYLDDLNLKYANLELLKSKNISVLLVRAPITTYEYNSFTNNDLIDSLYSSKANFYNFQDRVKLSDRFDFLDHAHLNQNGVRKFNRELLKIQQIIETLENDVKSDDNISMGLMSK